MKYLLAYFFLIFFLSCSHIKKELTCENSLTPKENIKALIDSFVLENKNDNYIYELYIDKQDPDNFNLLFYAGEKSLTDKENEVYEQVPVAYTIIHGKRINIYSGIERYFTNQKVEKREKINANEAKQVLWAVKDSLGVLMVYEIDGGYPFIPFPLKNEPDTFAPPVITSD